jgi:mono/diheme cytochrome c family protein
MHPLRVTTRVIGLAALSLGLSSCQRSKDFGTREQPGAQIFTSICARCHGSDGKGGVPALEGTPAPRNFCDAAFQKSRTDEQLIQVIRQGKGAMPAFGNLYSEEDLKGLVLKIRSFNPEARHP